MKIYSDTTVYVLCPANVYTGGPELLHQFCSTLLQYGIEVCLLYHDEQANFDIDDPVDRFYKKYHVPYTKTVLDDKRNILVTYEAASQGLYSLQHTRRVLWWLSVDNYLNSLKGTVEKEITPEKALTQALPEIFYFSKLDDDIEHWVQSEYARQFIKLNGIPDERIYFVGDYLTQTFVDKASSVDLTAKKNQVAYNPGKGFEVTELLIESAPEIDWKPIRNMTPEQVQALLAESKVYIDFGGHPGKDRIPREAAISGCVVITGRRGSAANNVDVNIPDEFKFDDRNLVPAQIIDKIKKIFDNFEVEYAKQKRYRKRIMKERQRFVEDVANVFGLPSLSVARVKSVALFKLNEKSIDTAKFMLESQSGYVPLFVIDDVASGVILDRDIGPFRREHHGNYFYLSETYRLEVISVRDAKFLYDERRIMYLATVAPDAEDIQKIREDFQASDDRILVID